MSGRRSSGEIVHLEEYQVERATVDYESDEPSGPTSRTAPTKIGRYTMLDLLGVGGMGVVCTAYDPKLDRKVALKLLRKRPKDDRRHSTGQARLIREAQSLAKLSHPNIVTVHDVDKVDNQIYMAMEYVDGHSLDKWMVQAERTWREVVQVFVHAARGLAAAHVAGITHRDFKPANVLIGKDGRVLVVDFGLAKSQEQEDRLLGVSGEEVPRMVDPAEFLRERGSLMEVIGTTQDTKLTQVGRTVGTPAYMAPEQFLGLTVGPDTDQFSFGVALFEALYGYLPFPDDNREELIERVTAGKVAEIPKDTAVPTWVHRVVLRALQKRSEDRYPNMDALIAALQADPAKRRRRVLASLGAVLLAGMGAYGVAQSIAAEGDMCTGAAERMEDVWGDARRAEVEAAFEATDFAYAPDAWVGVAKEMDKRVEDWVDHHTEVCKATNVRREQSDRLMDVRMACLERRRVEMRALVEVFVSPDENVVLEAVKAAQSLEDSGRCTTQMDGAGFAVDPKDRPQVEEIEGLLARAKAMHVSGSSEGAVEVAAAALRASRLLGNRTLMAQAAIRHSTWEADVSDDLGATRQTLIEAIALAAETDQHDLEAQGWSKLIEVEGVKRGHPQEALAFRIPAEMAIGREGDQRLRAFLLQSVGAVLNNSNDHEGALAAQLEALEHYRAIYGEQHSMIAAMLSNIGAEYMMLGQTDDALRYLEDAATLIEGLYGSLHPVLGSVWLNVGAVLQKAGDDAGARARYMRATKVFESSLPDGHPRLLKAMVGLAQTERVIDPESAEKRFEDVLAVIRAQKDPDLRVMVASYNSLASLRRRRANELDSRGRSSDAAVQRRKAFQDYSAALGVIEQQERDARSAQQVVLVNRGFCRLELDLGHPERAAEFCRVAWEAAQSRDSLSKQGTRAAEYLAIALNAQGERDEALDVLRRAIEASPNSQSVSLRLARADLMWQSRDRRRDAIASIKKLQEELIDTQSAEGQREELKSVQQWLDEHKF